ncbi:radical SAM protein [Psychromonas sp. SA13A]|uniref:B12-binding domain-containing radical SAM protein n=1 Tax=Psychromonas sp. SA13A TaxID=2686346 RepID=UPI00140B623D|nr:radical SAM protein [Psychromonas sp. SA13A]
MNKISVLLVNPPWYQQPQEKIPGWHGVRAGSRWPHDFPYYSHTVKNGIVSELLGTYIPFPFWLATASALLKENGYDAYLHDSIALGETYESFTNFVQNYNADFMVFETASATLEHDLSIIDKIKKYDPSVVIILTGLHIELEDPSFLQAHPQIDYIVYGEYEGSLLNLMKALEGEGALTNVSGLVYRDSLGKVNKTNFIEVSKFNHLPWPDRSDKNCLKNYNDTASGLPTPQLQIMATRGCPYGCVFCIWPQIFYKGGKFRKRDAEDVVSELSFYMEGGDYKSFYLDDDTFNINRKFVIELAEKISEAGLNKYPWGVMGRADLIDQEQLDALHKAGLHSAKFGVESASQEVLDNAKKHISIDKVIEGIKLTHAMGIKVHLTFTIGLPGDTKKSIESTIELACQLPCESVQFSIATPYPGTTMYDNYKQEGWLVSDKWSDYVGSSSAVCRTENFSAAELEYYVQHAMSRYAEADSLRKLGCPNFISRLEKKLSNTLKPGATIVVLQSARVSFTCELIKALIKLGYQISVYTHHRFNESFELIKGDLRIHSFSESSNFELNALKQNIDDLLQKNKFEGVVIPYSHRFGSGYDEVENVAKYLGGSIVAGINLDGEIIK